VADLRGGIDLGGTKIQAAIIDGRGDAVGQSRHPTPTSGGPEDVAVAMAGRRRKPASRAATWSGELVWCLPRSPNRVITGSASNRFEIKPAGSRDRISS